MRDRIAEVLSRLLSEQYDAKIKIIFKEREDEQRRDNHRTSRVGSDAGKRDRQVEKKNR
jgi:hypothetical protein